MLNLETLNDTDETDAIQLCLSNIYANQKTIFSKHSNNGFQFESNRQDKLKFVSEEKLSFIEGIRF
jgi:hypothetical protein